MHVELCHSSAAFEQLAVPLVQRVQRERRRRIGESSALRIVKPKKSTAR